MKIRPSIDRNGTPGFTLDARDYGQGRRFFTTMKEATDEKNRLENLGKENAAKVNAVPVADATELAEVLAECAALGTTPRVVLDYWKLGHLTGAPKTVFEVWRELLAEKAGCDVSYAPGWTPVWSPENHVVRENTLKALGEGPLRQFSEMYGTRFINQITTADVEKFILSRKLNPGGKTTALGRLSGLFTLAIRKKYIRGVAGALPENPCDSHPAIPEVDIEPHVLSNDQVVKILNYTRTEEPDMLAFLVLGLFCGLRPDEARQMEWYHPGMTKEDPRIDPEDWTVKITGKITKVNSRRMVTPRATAKAWLAEAKRIGAPLPLLESTKRDFVHRLAVVLKLHVIDLAKGKPAVDSRGNDRFAWPDDCIRHTCATNWISIEKQIGNVATELGTSVAMLNKHYKALRKLSVAEAFWNLLPGESDGKTLAFPKVA